MNSRPAKDRYQYSLACRVPALFPFQHNVMTSEVHPAPGVRYGRSGFRSISLVPSRQSSPRTCSVPPSTPTSATTDEAIGFGRTGDRSAKVPVVRPVLSGVCRTRSRRATMHPVQHLDAWMIAIPVNACRHRSSTTMVQTGPSRLPRLGHSLAASPGGVDRPDEIHAGVGCRGKRHRDFALARFTVVLSVGHDATVPSRAMSRPVGPLYQRSGPGQAGGSRGTIWTAVSSRLYRRHDDVVSQRSGRRSG